MDFKTTFKKTIAFIAGLAGTAFIYVIFFFIYSVSTFHFLGWQPLGEVKREAAGLFFMTLVLSVLLAFIVFSTLLKKRRKVTAAGAAIVIIIALCLAAEPPLPLYFDAHQQFDKTLWIEKHPFEMAKTLHESHQLTGLTKAQVVEKLGTDEIFVQFPDRLRGLRTLEYYTTEGWEFRVIFNNDTVKETSLYTVGIDL